jgi:hypothetical protein
MLTKTPPRFLLNNLNLVTPKIAVYMLKISVEDFIKYSTVGVSREELKIFENNLTENEIRNATIFNPNLMKLFLNENEIYNSKSLLKREYKKSLKKHNEYISDLNKIVESSLKPNPKLNNSIEVNGNNSSKDYSIMFDRLYEESSYTLEIEDDFDASKLACHIEELYLEKNKEYLNCHWRYGDKPLSFISNKDISKEDIYILSTSSERFNIKKL